MTIRRPNPDDSYASYLIRFWREASREASGWQAQVESIQTGQSWRFSDFDALVAFLQGSAPAGDEAISEGEQSDN